MMQAPAQLIQPNQLPCVYHADNHLIQTFQHTLCLLGSKFWQWQYSYGKPHATLISGVNSMKTVEFLTVQYTQNGIIQENVHQLCLLAQGGNSECTMTTNSVVTLLRAYTLQN